MRAPNEDEISLSDLIRTAPFSVYGLGDRPNAVARLRHSSADQGIQSITLASGPRDTLMLEPEVEISSGPETDTASDPDGKSQFEARVRRLLKETHASRMWLRVARDGPAGDVQGRGVEWGDQLGPVLAGLDRAEVFRTTIRVDDERVEFLAIEHERVSAAVGCHRGVQIEVVTTGSTFDDLRVVTIRDPERQIVQDASLEI